MSRAAAHWLFVLFVSLALVGVSACGGDDNASSSVSDADIRPDAGDHDAGDIHPDADDHDAADPCTALQCGEASCVVDNDGARCDCPTGTSFEPTTRTCELNALLESAGFDDASAWEIQRGASIDESTGELLLGPNAILDGAMVRQTYTLGEYDEIGPLVLEITATYDRCAGFLCDWVRTRPVVLFDNHRQPFDALTFPGAGQSATSSTCLGPAAYGGERRLTVMSGFAPRGLDRVDFDRLPSWRIDELHIRRASPDECPVPGSIPGGGFDDPAAPNWQFNVETVNTVNHVVLDDVGYKIRLGGTECSNARAATLVNIPRDPGTAITFDAEVTGDTSLNVISGQGGIRHFVQKQSETAIILCVPDSDLGTVQRLQFKPALGGGVCARPIDDIFVDNVRFTHDERCVSDNSIPGGDFEPSLFTGDWGFLQAAPGSVTIDVEDTPLGTNNYLRLISAAVCEHPTASLAAYMPMPEHATFNAISFFYRTVDEPNSRPNLSTLVTGARYLPPSPRWQRESICLDVTPHGHFVRFNVNLRDFTPGLCRDPKPVAAEFHLDELQFASLPTCVD